MFWSHSIANLIASILWIKSERNVSRRVADSVVLRCWWDVSVEGGGGPDTYNVALYQVWPFVEGLRNFTEIDIGWGGAHVVWSEDNSLDIGLSL